MMRKRETAAYLTTTVDFDNSGREPCLIAPSRVAYFRIFIGGGICSNFAHSRSRRAIT